MVKIGMNLLLLFWEIFSFRPKETPRYTHTKFLGGGNTGKVYEYFDHLKQRRVAVKFVSLPLNTDAEYQEVDCLRSLSGKHPSFLRFYSSVSRKKQVKIITEVIEGKELFSLVEKTLLSEAEIQWLFWQLVSAIKISHDRQIIHRDLKLEHLYLCGKTLKILDWGFSVSLAGGKKYTNACGSPHYVAPEILGNIPIVGPQNDVWALGVILYEMLTQKSLIDASTQTALFDKIRRFQFNLDSSLPRGARLLLKKILVHHSVRPTCDQILRDPWLSKFRQKCNTDP